MNPIIMKGIKGAAGMLLGKAVMGGISSCSPEQEEKLAIFANDMRRMYGLLTANGEQALADRIYCGVNEGLKKLGVSIAKPSQEDILLAFAARMDASHDAVRELEKAVDQQEEKKTSGKKK